MLQVCLNGSRSPDAAPLVPCTPEQLAADAAEVARMGAGSVHLHPRTDMGYETLEAGEVGVAVSAVRQHAPHLRVGVSTGAWIVPDQRERLQRVAGWAQLGAGRPDMASVNVHEPGWRELCVALHAAGIGVEIGCSTTETVRALRASGSLPAGTARVLLETEPVDPATARDAATAMLHALGNPGISVLLHGEGAAAWTVLTHAARRGLDIRIGLEDVLTLPDGTAAHGNVELVRGARELIDAERAAYEREHAAPQRTEQARDGGSAA